MDEMFEELFEDFRSDFPIEEALFTKVSDLSEQLHRVKERLNESTNMHTVVEDMRKAVEKILADLRNGRLLLPLLKDTIVDATRPFDSLQSLRPDLPNPFEAHDAVDDVMTDRRLEPNEDDVAAMLGELASLSDYLSWETTEYRDEMHMIERELGRVKSQLDRERHRVVSIAVALRQRQLRQQQAASHHMSHLSLSSHSSHQFAAGQAPYQPSPSPSPSQMMSPASPTTSLSPSVSAALNAAMAMSASRASMSDVGSSGYSAYGAAAPWGYVGSTGGTLTRRGSIQSEAQWSEASRRESRMSTRPVQTDMLARSPPGMPHGFTHASGRALAQSHSAAAAAAARELPAWASSAAASARAEQQQQQPGSRSSFMSRKMSSRR
nr:hypothetical protein HK105_005345 [Polyrhizophydium stewartii]